MKELKKIEEYLAGNLSIDEQKEFLSRLKTDDSLNAFLKFNKEINESISDSEVYEFRKQLSSTIKEKPTQKKIHIVLVLGIAVTIILSISLFSIIKQPNFEKAFTTFYQPHEVDINVRSVEESSKNIDFAYLLYQEGDFEASFEILKNYNKKVFNDPTAQFYYSLCALEINKYDIAEENLKLILETENSALLLHSQWYLSMLYLKTNEPDKAEIYLRELSIDQNFYAERVKKILKKYY